MFLHQKESELHNLRTWYTLTMYMVHGKCTMMHSDVPHLIPEIWGLDLLAMASGSRANAEA